MHSENGVHTMNEKLQCIPDMSNFGMVMHIEHCGYLPLLICLFLNRLFNLYSFLWLNDWPLIDVMNIF